MHVGLFGFNSLKRQKEKVQVFSLLYRLGWQRSYGIVYQYCSFSDSTCRGDLSLCLYGISILSGDTRISRFLVEKMLEKDVKVLIYTSSMAVFLWS